MKNSIMKTWRKMKSFGNTSSSNMASMTKSKSWNGSVSSPQPGYFTVYVGSKKQRILVKTKLVNHPSFKKLLEDAENEFGYICDGPIVLPCEVDDFLKVLDGMKKRSNDGYDDDYDDDDDGFANSPICGFGSPCGGGMMRRNSSYKLLRSPSLFKLNRT